MLLQLGYLDWENQGPDIPERRADARETDPKRKWSREEEGEDPQWRKGEDGGEGLSYRSGRCKDTNTKDSQDP